MKTLRAAVIGVGYLGTFHAQKYKNNPNVELIGVFDQNTVQAKKTADSLGVKYFEKMEDLIGKIDLATVATSTQAHFSVSEFLIKNGIHVNIEKPITAHLKDAEKLIQLAQEKNVKISVGHIERFNPAFVQWRNLMKVPRYIEFERMGPFKSRGADVSVVHDLMIHDIDLLLNLKLGKIVDIQAQGSPEISETYDWAVVWCSFESGVKACLKASRVAMNPSRVIRSYEKEVQWIVHLNKGELEKIRYERGESPSLVVENVKTDAVDALQVETDTFIDCIQNHQVPKITGEDGLAALKLAEQIQSILDSNPTSK